MQPVPRPLLLLHPDERVQARVRDAAGSDYAVETVSSWEALGEALRAASPAAVVVVDPYFGSGTRVALAPELRALLREFPTAAVLAALEIRAERYSDLHTLGTWGVMEVIWLEKEDVRALRELLRSARGRPLQSLLERSLPERLTGRARVILQMAAEVAAEGKGGEVLAKRLHVTLRTLLRWCEQNGLPPPRKVLAWMRILLAAEMLEQPGRTIESVATACGYASESGLRRACYDFLGMSPRALRKSGGFATAAERFRQALAAGRKRREGRGVGV